MNGYEISYIVPAGKTISLYQLQHEVRISLLNTVEEKTIHWHTCDLLITNVIKYPEGQVKYCFLAKPESK